MRDARLPRKKDPVACGHQGVTPTTTPFGIVPDVWLSIRTALQIPHFSNTKRLDLVHQTNIPIIFGEVVRPVLSCKYLFVDQEFDISSETRRLYYGRCQVCLEEDMRHNAKIDLLVCSYCGNTSEYNDHFFYVSSNRRKHVSRKFSTDFDKRISHFRFWLKRLQGKERNKVTRDVVELVKQHLKKNNVTAIHYWSVRNSLKTLKLQKYYYNTVTIMNSIRGRPLFNLSRSHEETLINMFMELQDVFSTLQHKRVNMLSYPYVIRKLCELKGWKQMAKIIPSLKSHIRIVTQNELWRYICQVKGWTFIPTEPWSSQETRAIDGKPR